MTTAWRARFWSNGSVGHVIDVEAPTMSAAMAAVYAEQDAYPHRHIVWRSDAITVGPRK